MNRDTEYIYYNQRMIIDNKVETEPRTWIVTKVNRISSNGVCMITLAQDLFDPNRDFIEKDEYGNIIGMWADYINKNQYDIKPEEIVDPRILPDYSLSLKYAGIKPVIKVRGNFKKLTATFVDKHGNEVPDVFVTEWRVELDGEDINLMEESPIIVHTSFDDDTLTANQIKIKTTSDDVLGKIVTITAIRGGLTSTQNLEIVGM